MSSFTAVVTCHAREWNLRHLLGNLAYQSRTVDETLVFVSGVTRGAFARLGEDFPHATFFLENDRQDWGHAKRAAGVERAGSDYLGFFNDDDSYDDFYVETMMGAAESNAADVVYCAWSTYPDCEFRLGQSTSGNFIVRSSLARVVGYPGDRVYENDGVFIDGLAAEADPIVYIPTVLYRHNVQ